MGSRTDSGSSDGSRAGLRKHEAEGNFEDKIQGILVEGAGFPGPGRRVRMDGRRGESGRGQNLRVKLTEVWHSSMGRRRGCCGRASFQGHLCHPFSGSFAKVHPSLLCSHQMYLTQTLG